MLYTWEENFNNGDDDFFVFKSQGGGSLAPPPPPGHAPDLKQAVSQAECLQCCYPNPTFIKVT